MKEGYNGEPISDVIKRELQKFINKIAKKYPNDQNLGEAIRELRTHE